MFGLFDWFKIGVGGVLGAVAIFGVMSVYDATIDDPAVRRAEREEVLAEARTRALLLIEQRSADDEEISDLDMAGLCAELGGKWIDRESRCD